MLETTILRLARRASCAALAAALLAPTGAAAAGTKVVTAGPLKVGDYELRVVGMGKTVSVSFSRTSGGSTQLHGYSFAAGGKVTPRAITADLGRYGAISLKLSAGRKGPGSVPPGCTGTPGATTKGTFKGSLRFVTGPGAFGTVTAKRLPAEVSDLGTLACDDEPASGPGAERKLTLLAQEGAAMTTFEATPTGQSVTVLEDQATTAPASVLHSIDARGTGLDAAPDLAAASVPAIGPFLAGAGTYEGMAIDIGSFGQLGGSLVARFDVIGDVPLRGDAMIQ